MGVMVSHCFQSNDPMSNGRAINTARAAISSFSFLHYIMNNHADPREEQYIFYDGFDICALGKGREFC